MRKTFVGFGFGPILSGLFLFEARASGNFDRLVVAEVDKATVGAVKKNNGTYTVNIARADRVDRAQVAGIEILDPSDPADRKALVAAVAESPEMATCLPSVNFYDTGGVISVARLIADGLAARKEEIPTIIYAAENHNRAAELLREAVAAHVPSAQLAPVQTLNTVIGKMSGVVADREEIEARSLAPVAPGLARAILVEEFNRILIERVRLPGCKREIEVLIEKDDLLPFEEAKLYGHNAVHALVGFLAAFHGINTIPEAGRNAEIMKIARAAFINESGAALVKRHGHLADPLFTPAGYTAYAEDLLRRMTNPHLNDPTARICRDPLRKLGCDDRLFGTMRLALEYDIVPRNLALGAAAALACLMRDPESRKLAPNIPDRPESLTQQEIGRLLASIWQGKPDRHSDRLVELTREALTDMLSRIS